MTAPHACTACMHRMHAKSGNIWADACRLTRPIQARKDERQAAGPRPPQGAAYDPAVIIPVLAHRADRSASKFLKKELSLPKSEASPKHLAGLTSGLSRLTTKMRSAASMR